MPASITLHPETKEKILLFSVMPEVWSAPQVMGLLRILHAHFPNEYEAVRLEIVPNANGSRLQLPDEFGEKKNGS